MPVKYLTELGHFSFAEKNSPLVPPGCTLPGQSPEGYGAKISTNRVIRLLCEKQWRRVYATCFGNAASHWIILNGEKIHLP